MGVAPEADLIVVKMPMLPISEAVYGHVYSENKVMEGAAAPRSRSERMKGIVSARIPGDQGGAKHPLPSTEPRDADDIPTLLDPKPGC